ncbi:hypothetical protein PGT21_026662 [Puccinia graminis f. sp. tritici]|uniref:Uncharacterized protein n=1 Tax=Puccinia graminis f. sp. tritici TaxID=56615 RepID=A0A5B0M159_PUCGR|nr:hypothetical protein PGT21_026662 [Puccinia graminis f. sp. tritici]
MITTTILKYGIFQLFLSWCFTVSWAAGSLPDLNLPLPGCLEESAAEPTSASHPISGTISELFPRKRKSPLDFSPPTSRACLSHAQDGLLMLTSTNTRFTDQSDFAAIHAGGEKSTGLAVGFGIGESITESKPSQFSSNRGLDFINLSKPLELLPPPAKLPVRPLLQEESKNPNESVYGHFIYAGQIVEELLNKHSVMFEREIKNLRSTNQIMKDKDHHPSLPFCRVDREKGEKGKIFRVMVASKDHLQIIEELPWRYNRLLTVLYKLHQNYLNDRNITTFNQRTQHENLLGWLSRQIFRPDDSVPVFGIVNEPNLPWESGDPKIRIGACQIELINFFSKDRCDVHDILQLTASYLLREYYAQNKITYSALVQPSEYISDVEIVISMKPHFQEMLKALSDIMGYSIRYRKLLNYRMPKFEPFLDFCSNFELQLRQTEIRAGWLRSNHPKLPIVMYFPKKSDSHGHIRIIDPECGDALDSTRLSPRFKRFLKWVDHLNIKSLGKLGIRGEKLNKIRIKMFEWILKSIAQPTIGLPLIGTCKIEKGIAPWFDLAYESQILFGEIQLKLIRYFSEYPNDKELQTITPFILTSFYHDNLPDIYRSLCKKFQIKNACYSMPHLLSKIA